jgi:hypothetical protein
MATAAKSRRDKLQPARSALAQPFFLDEFRQLIMQLLVGRFIRFAARPNEHIDHRVAVGQAGQHLEAKDFPQPPFQQVALYRIAAMLRYHYPDAGMRNRGSGVEDVQVGRPAPLPPLK